MKTSRRLALIATALFVVRGALGEVRAQTVTVSDLVAFDSGTFGNPSFTPAQGRDGLLYGSISGHYTAAGYFFDFTTSGVTQILYTPDPKLGYGLISSLTLDTDGNYYAAILDAGVSGSGAYGDLVQLTPSGKFTVLYTFQGGADGAFPNGAPIEASDGNLYGVTYGGCCIPSTVYRYTRSGVFSTIYTFPLAQGEWANAILQGSDGNLYVTCAAGGGTGDNGTIAKLTTSGTLLYSYAFPGRPGGAAPGSLVETSDGNYYGTTVYGGEGPARGLGTIYRLTPSGKVTVIYTFSLKNQDGQFPGWLMLANDGFLYSATLNGGANNDGTLFRISTTKAYTQLYSFATGIGSNAGRLMQDTSGMIYGTAYGGSTYGFGAILSINAGLGPFITFVRASGKVSQTAQILGQGLKGTTKVTFNGVPATSFKVISQTYMTAVVPSGATSGPVVVTTPTGTLTSNKNFVIRP